MAKKVYYLSAVIIAIFVLAGCNQHQKEIEKTNVTEKKDVNEQKRQDVKENNEQKSKDINKPVQNQPVKVPSVTVYQNEVFKDVTVAESGDEMIVAGKAQVFEGVFRYALYAGDKVIVENNYQTKGAPAWGDFKITFKKELVTTNNMTFQLFVLSAKDGSKVNVLNVPIAKH